MPTDYDAPRTTDPAGATSALDELDLKPTARADSDEAEVVESLELPGADLSGEELTVRVVPKQEDEFTCTRCFLVQHHSRKVSAAGEDPYCRDCA
ncbi:DUF4193 domain-containing protein [Rhodococcus chondri]|uniref:DUF4193 domain-containing protein n=1 Tax=Rhodococcus chondri TaxID=3065941 RepID=A0ABU7JWV5_9NOCA|nr:DUF4193 domain-containing protein [Rhodococcus sp. CC-R104]MEE2034504.1 DUF4193 domain-containing protein [Rhodococcus sp. CC-R104]